MAWPDHAFTGDGRWDNPTPNSWRVLYLGDTALASYLEVLAKFRADPALDELDDIDVDETDEREAHTAGGKGRLPRSWLTDRLRVEALFSGRYLDVADPNSLASLNRKFGRAAKNLGMDAGVDLSAITSGSRHLTQQISASFYTLAFDSHRSYLDGIQYPSRHGANLTLWALYERPAHRELTEITRTETVTPTAATDPDFQQAMQIHGLKLE